jgi:hypothetical protein
MVVGTLPCLIECAAIRKLRDVASEGDLRQRV